MGLILSILALALLPAKVRARDYASAPCASYFSQIAKQKFYVDNNILRDISYGYELEFSLKEANKILNYYRDPQMSDEAWNMLPHREKLKIADRLTAQAKRGQRVLERMEHTPKYLASEAIAEIDGRLELANNGISQTIVDTMEQIEWFFENIGAASVQGHVVFPETKVLGMAGYVKQEFDISQAEAFVHGFETYLGTGKMPPRNLRHPALGLLDADSLALISEKTGQNVARASQRMTEKTKYIYGTTFREDPYGEERIGVEIRNCHKRLDCLRSKMVEASLNAERGFMAYRGLDLDIVINEKIWNAQPADIRSVLEKIGEYLQANNGSRSGLGGAPYKMRFLFPLLDWKSHPFVKVLPPSEQRRFLELQKSAQERFLNEVRKIGGSAAPTDKQLDGLELEVARAVHSMNLATLLEEGKGLWLKRHGFFQAEKYMFSTEEVETLSAIPELHGGRWIHFKALFFKKGTNSNFKQVAELLRELGPKLEYLEKNIEQYPEFPELLYEASKLASEKSMRSLYMAKYGPRILKTLFTMDEADRAYIFKLIDKIGISSRGDSAEAFVLNRMLTELPVNPEMRLALREMRSQNVPAEAVADAMTSINLESLFLGIRESQVSPLVTFLFRGDREPLLPYLREFFTPRNFSSDQTPSAMQVMSLAADELEILGGGRFMATFESRKYLLTPKGDGELVVSEVTAKRRLVEKLSRKASALLEKRKAPLDQASMQEIVQKNPDKAYLVAHRGYWYHLGLVIKGRVYGLNDGSLRPQPFSRHANFMSTPLLLTELRTSPEQRALLEERARDLGKEKFEYSLNGEKGKVNCANQITCLLEGAKVVKNVPPVARVDAKIFVRHVIGQLADPKGPVEKVYYENGQAVKIFYYTLAYGLGGGASSYGALMGLDYWIEGKLKEAHRRYLTKMAISLEEELATDTLDLNSLRELDASKPDIVNRLANECGNMVRIERISPSELRDQMRNYSKFVWDVCSAGIAREKAPAGSHRGLAQ